MNYFDLFQLPAALELDVSELAKRYQRLQQLTHPDKFADASETQKRLAVQKNAQINDAYHTLKAPLSRARHLLQIRGLDIQDEQQTLQDTAFLMQQMAWREALEELPEQADPQQALAALMSELHSENEQLMQQLQTCLQQQNSEQDQHAAIALRKLTFLDKFEQQLDAQAESITG